MTPLEGNTEPLLWHKPDAPPLRLSGFPWHSHDRVYRRLPVAPPAKLPDAVDALANCTAGGQIAFQSDATKLAISVTLTGPANMNHMPATGQCGFDLYVGPPGTQRFHSTTKYNHTETSYEIVLFDDPGKVLRNFTLNFPLYQGITNVEIGVPPDAQVAPPAPWASTGRIVIYGTSITQGGCASRPGMAYTNILSRALNMEIINLGFSGSGRGEPEVIELVADIPDTRLIVLDYEANSSGRLHETLPESIRLIRSRKRDIPILVVSRIAYAKDAVSQTARVSRERSAQMQRELVRKAHRNGDDQIHFVDGSGLLGADFDECTVDGVHPTDLGFMRMAKGLEPGIHSILKPTETCPESIIEGHHAVS